MSDAMILSVCDEEASRCDGIRGSRFVTIRINWRDASWFTELCGVAFEVGTLAVDETTAARRASHQRPGDKLNIVLDDDVKCSTGEENDFSSGIVNH